MSSAYNEEMARFRRLSVLNILSESPAYTLHEHNVKANLAAQGQAIGTDGLRADLQWLEEQGLIYTQKPQGVWISTLTAKGDDVRQGLSRNPGVALPELK
jgi:repressor of nif and glnA expression